MIIKIANAQLRAVYILGLLETSTAFPRVKVEKIKVSFTGTKTATEKSPEILSRKRVHENQANSIDPSVTPIKKPSLTHLHPPVPESSPVTTKTNNEAEKHLTQPKNSQKSTSPDNNSKTNENLTKSRGEMRQHPVSHVNVVPQSSYLPPTTSCIETKSNPFFMYKKNS